MAEQGAKSEFGNIPAHWQFSQRGSDWYRIHRLSVQDNYISLMPSNAKPYEILFTDKKSEYFFNNMGAPICRRTYTEEGVIIALTGDIPFLEKIIEMQWGTNSRSGDITPDCFGVIAVDWDWAPPIEKRCAEIVYINNALTALDFETFIEGFPDNDSPSIAFSPEYNAQDVLVALILNELEDPYQHEGWKVIPNGQCEHVVKRADEEMFLLRTRIELSGLIVAEQEYLKEDSMGRGVRKIIRANSRINPHHSNRLATAALTETFFDRESNRVIDASWCDIDPLIGNPQLSYSGPVQALLWELQ